MAPTPLTRPNVALALAHTAPAPLSPPASLPPAGGGPYALACAALHPERFTAVALVAGMTHCSGPGAGKLMNGMALSNK